MLHVPATTAVGSLATARSGSSLLSVTGVAFWPLLFKNVRVDFLGSDDFTQADKEEAARATNEALLAGWEGMPIAEQFSLDEIATAHGQLETSQRRGRFVLVL